MKNFQKISTEENDIQLSCESSMHHYRTEIPNIILEMGLDPYQLSTYIHLKRSAGDRGKCWKSATTLCEEIGISKPKFRQIKQFLEEKGLIIIEQRNHESGANLTDFITIVDLWGLNMRHMSEKYSKKDEEGKPYFPGRGNHISRGGKPYFPKQDPIEQDPIEQQQAPPVHNSAAAVSFSIHPSLEQLPIPMTAKQRISSHKNSHRIEYAVEWVMKNMEKLKRGIAATITWILNVETEEELPDMPIDPNKVEEENRTYAMQFDGMKPNERTRICVGSKYLEVVNESGGYGNKSFDYKKKNFKQDFIAYIGKFYNLCAQPCQ